MGENRGVEGGLENHPIHTEGTGGSDDMPTPTSKRTTRAAFQFYPRDFLTSDKVARMSMTEVGIYFTLLCYAWMGHGLPKDLNQIAKLLRLPPVRFKKLWAGVLSECFEERKGRLINPRQERQRKELEDYIAACERGGRRSADTRKERYGTSQPLRGDSRSDAEVVPNTASASLSASAIASSPSGERRAPIARRRRMDAAYEHEGGIYVPQRAHDDFSALHPGEDLIAWYESVCASWRGRNTGADMFKFWKARHDETWPPEKPSEAARVAPRSSAWDCRHLERCANSTMCAVKDEHPSKYPVKATVSA